MNKKEFIRNRPFDEVDASQMQQWTEDGMIDYVKALSTDGVIIGLDTVANTGMTVKVKAGIALDSNYKILNVLTDQVVNLAAANATNSRIDVITLVYKNTKTDNVDTANKYNRGTSFVYSKNIVDGYQIKVYTGTPAASPVAPSISAGEVPLSQVLIPANATTPSTITDRKKVTAMVNAVAPIKSPTAPTQNLYDGLVWFNTTTKEFKVYINGAWEGINSHSHTIAQVTDLQAALDAKETPQGAQTKANTAETNAKNASVPRSGGTMTGELIMDGKDIGTKIPTSGNSWARGYHFRNASSVNMSGFGAYGATPSNIDKIYMAFGNSPWDPAAKGLSINIDGTAKLNGTLDANSFSEAGTNLSAKYAPIGTQITAGTGLSGGGQINANRTLNFDTTWGDARYVARAGSTMTGQLNIDANTSQPIKLMGGNADHVYVSLYARGADKALRTGYWGFSSAGTNHMTIANEISGGNINLTTLGGGLAAVNGSRILTESMEGHGNGIDADSVDGVHLTGLVQTSRKVNPGTGITGGGDLSADRSLSFDTTWGDGRYLNKSTGGNITGAVSMYALTVNPASATPTYLELGWQGTGAAATTIDFHSGGTAGVDYDSRIYASGGTATSGGGTLNLIGANIQANGSKILTQADEGSGKGIDADSVDGVHLSGLVQTSRKVNPGTGLTGGGDLAADRTLNFDTVWGDARYANVTGQTFTGSLGFSSQALGLGVTYVPSANTPGTWTSGAGITGGADTAGLGKINNIALQTWFGFSVSPTIANMEVPQGTPAFSVDARTGNVWAAKDFYAMGNQKVWHAGNFNPGTKVDTSRLITVGSGLTGGGDLSANRGIGLNFTSSGGNNGTAVSVARGDHLHDGVYAKTGGDIFTAPMEFKKGLSITGALDYNNVLNFPAPAAIRFDQYGNIKGAPINGTDIIFSIVDGAGRSKFSTAMGKDGNDSNKYYTWGGALHNFYIDGNWAIGMFRNGTSSGMHFDGGPILKYQRNMGRFEMRTWDDGAFADFAAAVMWSAEYRTHSTRDIKKNIEPAIFDALEVIKSTPIFDYNLKTEEDNEPKRRGMVVEESHPDVVAKDGKSVNMYSIDSTMWKALQVIIKVLEKNELI